MRIVPAVSLAHGAFCHLPPFAEATVTAGADGSFTLRWKARGAGRVEIKANGVVAEGGAEGRAVVTGLPAADRQWFDFEPERGGSLRLADRLIKLDGAVNFRDAGGYRTTTGQWVKMGEVYRSDALDKLTANDLAVRPEYLNSGYAEVKATYGSFDRYVKDGLGIDSRELRRLKKDLLVG
ncbi:tyrosine-protein phosphatase [Streptomyces sp. MB09-01]|uniref:tyrosine-protein phosphatase n=1 Tax=Streptomyces sp. MB09-01 TaxID=3028666 RepID=UPI0029B8C726|nr:tyrosine-protein phosphatase [Streptomyces sp. MB09-01]MDX3534653.1 tyrosine-protein phosphatase [Streptomyces sp. MB09-01]